MTSAFPHPFVCVQLISTTIHHHLTLIDSLTIHIVPVHSIRRGDGGQIMPHFNYQLIKTQQLSASRVFSESPIRRTDDGGANDDEKGNGQRLARFFGINGEAPF